MNKGGFHLKVVVWRTVNIFGSCLRLSCRNDEASRKCGVLACRFDTYAHTYYLKIRRPNLRHLCEFCIEMVWKFNTLLINLLILEFVLR